MRRPEQGAHDRRDNDRGDFCCWAQEFESSSYLCGNTIG